MGGVGTGRAELHQPLRIFHRQRPQHHGVENAEYGRIRADAQRQRKNRRGGEAWIGSQRTEGVADILRQRFKEWPHPDGAAGLADLRQVTERAAGG